MATIVTDEEQMEHNGEALPILSASAKKMRIDKLLATPLPTYTSSVPGSYLWTKVALDVSTSVLRPVSHHLFFKRGNP